VPRRLQPLVLLVLAIAVLAVGCSTDSQPDGFREGRSVYADTCSACHGSSGRGGVGPALDTVVETWPRCSDQIEWISLGSEGWRAEHGDTYGATEKPIEGGMPAHGDILTPQEIELVAAFERSQYGGLDSETALRECQTG
jgi:mono/diheme cytochrome c family protein